MVRTALAYLALDEALLGDERGALGALFLAVPHVGAQHLDALHHLQRVHNRFCMPWDPSPEHVMQGTEGCVNTCVTDTVDGSRAGLGSNQNVCRPAATPVRAGLLYEWSLASSASLPQRYLGGMLGVGGPKGQLLEADGARELDARLVARPEVEVQPDVRVVAVLRKPMEVTSPAVQLSGRQRSPADGSFKCTSANASGHHYAQEAVPALSSLRATHSFERPEGTRGRLVEESRLVVGGVLDGQDVERHHDAVDGHQDHLPLRVDLRRSCDTGTAQAFGD